MRIKLSTTLRWPIERQIPGDWQEQQGIEVVINGPADECDAWVVYQGLHRPEMTQVPRNRVFFFGYEPPGLHCYQTDFLNQFAAVVTCHSVDHPNAVYRHQAQPWLAGVIRNGVDNKHCGYGFRFDRDQLSQMERPEKTASVAVVCSRKVMTEGHGSRLEFLDRLSDHCGGELDLFGYGFRPLVDKWDALAPYHYHLVVENSCVPHYWTEKVADAFLGWCRPIVWGCPNLAEYFPRDSFVMLDPSDIDKSISLVLETISSPPTQAQFAAVVESRRMILEDYNLFSEIRRLIDATPPGVSEAVRIRDERLFLPGGWWRPAVRAVTDCWRCRNESSKQ